MTKKKPTPKLALTDLLRRRKMSLADYVSNSGITTYEKLLIMCERQFVLPPDRAKFDGIVGDTKSSASEGVAVIAAEPDPEPTSQEETLEGPNDTPPGDVEFPTVQSQRARRRRRGLPDPTINEPAADDASDTEHEEA